jgi:hypothetical protein
MEAIEHLRHAVSNFDATLTDLVSTDPQKREDAILDAAWLLTAAKRVVLES